MSSYLRIMGDSFLTIGEDSYKYGKGKIRMNALEVNWNGYIGVS